MGDELKSCNYCEDGGEPRIVNDGFFYVAGCYECGYTIGAYYTKESAIAAWNTRADDAPEQPVDNAQADSRERLEADMRALMRKLYEVGYTDARANHNALFKFDIRHPGTDFDPERGKKFIELLDRQDAITTKQLTSQSAASETAETGETDAAKEHMRDFDDSRERLVSEVMATVNNLVKYCDAHPALFEKAKSWLDRQEAITSKEWCHSHDALEEELERVRDERDELREELEDEKSENGWAREFLNRMGPKCGTADCPSLVAYVNNLEAERDVLRERLDAMKAVLDKWVKPTVGVEPPEHPMAQLQPNDGDSRERLEADVYDGFSDVALSEQMRDVLRSRVHAWLDRQEAITSSEWCYSHDALEEEVERLRGRLKEEMEDVRTLDIEGHVLADKLAAAEDMLHVVMKGGEPNYDEWIWQHDGLSDWFQENFTKTVPQLTAELDKANEAGDKLMNKLIDMTTERDELREYAAEKIAEFADKQRVIDVQRESFRKMEKDCADMSMALDKACKETGDTTGSCPWDKYNVKPRDCDKECKNQLAECWRLYFEGVRHGEEGSEG